MARILWLADKLRQWGLVTVEVDGWRTRGSDNFSPRAMLAHHTGGASTGDMPSLRVIRDGRPDLPGPLAHVGLGRSGTCYVVASGRCNHAGTGKWLDITSGNTSMVSVEAENDGVQGWPEVQVEAYVRLSAAICDGLSVSAAWVAGHKEYATPPGRKPDPHHIDMTAFRERVRNLLAGDDDMFTDADRALLQSVQATAKATELRAADAAAASKVVESRITELLTNDTIAQAVVASLPPGSGADPDVIAAKVIERLRAQLNKP